MKLDLHLDGSIEPLIKYLESYFNANSSLLLEIDTEKHVFIAKGLDVSGSSVRFASLNFEDTNIKVLSDDGEAERNGARIKVGILTYLGKFINFLKHLENEVKKHKESNFDIIFTYAYMEYLDQYNKTKTSDYVTTNVVFKTPQFKMCMKNFRINELMYISDDNFINSVFTVNDGGMRTQITSGDIESITKLTKIIAKDKVKDTLVFYVTNGMLHVKAMDGSVSGGDDVPEFDYEIGAVDRVIEGFKPITISRDTFDTMMSKCDDDFSLILGESPHDRYGVIRKLMFDSTTSTAKIVITSQL